MSAAICGAVVRPEPRMLLRSSGLRPLRPHVHGRAGHEWAAADGRAARGGAAAGRSEEPENIDTWRVPGGAAAVRNMMVVIREKADADLDGRGLSFGNQLGSNPATAVHDAQNSCDIGSGDMLIDDDVGHQGFMAARRRAVRVSCSSRVMTSPC